MGLVRAVDVQPDHHGLGLRHVQAPQQRQSTNCADTSEPAAARKQARKVSGQQQKYDGDQACEDVAVKAKHRESVCVLVQAEPLGGDQDDQESQGDCSFGQREEGELAPAVRETRHAAEQDQQHKGDTRHPEQLQET